MKKLIASLAVITLVSGCAVELPSSLLEEGSMFEGIVGENGEDDRPAGTEDESGKSHHAAGEENTFSHLEDLSPDRAKDPFEILEQRRAEGPPEVRTRLHSCNKLSLEALATILATFGVDLDAEGEPPPAGQLLREGVAALGAANFEVFNGESLVWSNSSSSKAQDIFVLAAPEVIAAFPTLSHCDGAALFDDNGCVADGVSCLIGRPATSDHVAICNHAVTEASSRQQGEIVAVAAMMAAAYTCQ